MRKTAIVLLAVLVAATHAIPATTAFALDRSRLWAEDIDSMRDAIFENYFSDPANVPVARTEFSDKCEQLKERLPEIDDETTAFEMQRLLALLKDGHANIFFRPKAKYLYMAEPVGDEFYVTRSLDSQKRIRRCRLVEIDGIPMKKVRSMLEPFISFDSRYSVNESMTELLMNPRLLSHAGICRSSERCVLKLENADGNIFAQEVMALVPSEINKMNIDQGYWDKIRNDPPLCHQNKSFYNLHYIEDRKTVYINYQKCAEDQNYPFRLFVSQLDSLWKEKRPERLVFDIRFNNGGSTTVFFPFLEWVSNNDFFREPGRLNVIIGNKVFSAASQTAALLYLLTDCTFVGEPIGQKPNHWGQVKSLKLRNSGLVMLHSTRYMEIIRDSDPESIMPDTWLSWSRDDYFNLKDSVLEGILDGKVKEKARKTCIVDTKRDRWKRDLKLAQAVMMLKHPDLADSISRTELERRFDELVLKSGDYDRYDLILESGRMFGDMGSQAPFFHDPSLLAGDAMPIAVECIGGEILITRVSSINKKALGCVLLGIGGVDLGEIGRKFGSCFHVSDWNRFLTENTTLVLNIEVLRRLGIKIDLPLIPIRIRHQDGRVEEFRFSNTPIESRFGSASAPGLQPGNVPLYQSGLPYALLKESHTAYVNPFGAGYRPDHGLFADFARDLENGKISAVAIDFRPDSRRFPGDFSQDMAFAAKISRLVENNDTVKAYAIVDEMASARAVWLAGHLKASIKATVVGKTPSIGIDRLYAHESVRLPYISLTSGTGVLVDIVARRFAIDGLKAGARLEVDREIALGPSHYLSGKDPVMDWIVSVRP